MSGGQQERLNRFLRFLAYLKKNGGTLRKCYLFYCRNKNVPDIDKKNENENNFEIGYYRFSPGLRALKVYSHT